MPAPKTATKLFAVLELVRREPGLRLSDLAQRLSMSVATCARLLTALCDSGLVIKRHNRFELGPYCLSLGEAFRSEFDLGRDARPFLEELSTTSGETTHLGVVDGLSCVYIDKVDSPQSIRMHSRIGRRSPMHSTGIGKALLSALPADMTEAVIDGGLERQTERTITDPEHFRDEIATIAERGYSIDDIENEDGIRCIAAPIVDRDGLAVAAISIAGPETRLTLERVSSLIEPLLNATQTLGRHL